MDIIIDSPGFTAGESLEDFTRQKLQKLDKLANIIRANVTLYLGPPTSPGRHHCEVRLEIPGNDLFVERGADDFERAIIEVTDVLQQNLDKKKKKQIDSYRGVQD
jgi:putative sigma-54 modulation protein